MPHDPDMLRRLADNRRKRLRDGRVHLEITRGEAERSSATAMRLARAARRTPEGPPRGRQDVR